MVAIRQPLTQAVILLQEENMGYYTEYSLEVQVSEEHDDIEIIGQLREENENAAYAINENGEYYQECKWYDHEKDLIEFSKKYPYALFTLSGVGEEQPDMWRMYFKNGKRQKAEAQISFTPYQESLLR